MGTFNNKIENVVLIAYQCKSTKKLGTLRIAENSPETLQDLISLMKRDLQSIVYGSWLKIIELEAEKQTEKVKSQIAEIENHIKYLSNLKVAIVLLRDNAIIIDKSYDVQYPSKDNILSMLEQRKAEEMEEKSEAVANEAIKGE